MKYTEKVMNIVKGALSKMEQLTGQIEDLNRRFKAEEISGVDDQAQKAELEKQLNAARYRGTADAHAGLGRYGGRIEGRQDDIVESLPHALPCAKPSGLYFSG